jgi:hypothetical protein
MMNGVLLTNGLPVINLPASKQLEFNQLMLDFYPSNNEAPMRALMLFVFKILNKKFNTSIGTGNNHIRRKTHTSFGNLHTF